MSRSPRSVSGQPPLTQAALVQAALAVLERDGLDLLSMRRVAAELDLQAASLYWHVRNKEELLELLADAALAGMDLSGSEGGWREQVRVLAHRYRAFLKSRRDLARLVAGRFVVGPNASRMMEHGLAVFREAGFSAGGASAAVYLVSVTYVQGFVVQEMNPMRAVEALGGTPAEAMAVVSAELADLPAQTFPHLTEAAQYMTAMNLDERFDWGLECILDGLEMRLAGSQVRVEAGGAPSA